MIHDAHCKRGNNGIALLSMVENIVLLYESWQTIYLENNWLQTWTLGERVNATYMCNLKITSKGTTAKINVMLHTERLSLFGNRTTWRMTNEHIIVRRCNWTPLQILSSKKQTSWNIKCYMPTDLYEGVLISS